MWSGQQLRLDFPCACHRFQMLLKSDRRWLKSWQLMFRTMPKLLSRVALLEMDGVKKNPNPGSLKPSMMLEMLSLTNLLPATEKAAQFPSSKSWRLFTLTPKSSLSVSVDLFQTLMRQTRCLTYLLLRNWPAHLAILSAHVAVSKNDFVIPNIQSLKSSWVLSRARLILF